METQPRIPRLFTLRPKNGVHLRVQRWGERRARMSAA
jgi:hypothetical protein